MQIPTELFAAASRKINFCIFWLSHNFFSVFKLAKNYLVWQLTAATWESTLTFDLCFWNCHSYGQS